MRRDCYVRPVGKNLTVLKLHRDETVKDHFFDGIENFTDSEISNDESDPEFEHNERQTWNEEK